MNIKKLINKIIQNIISKSANITNGKYAICGTSKEYGAGILFIYKNYDDAYDFYILGKYNKLNIYLCNYKPDGSTPVIEVDIDNLELLVQKVIFNRSL